MSNIHNHDTPSDLVNVSEAQRILGVSHFKMSQLIKDGMLNHYPNPIDRRQKLLSKAEVEALKPKRAEAA
jgi:DNA-binding MarR family transcriptional regulator